ncbi:MAG TPA: phosphate ABC transporter substrate-binding protein PstS [Candidatus Dormibacteraeota bacterium]|nr:phosphate ABC transporter substrate-binding protein PstS [Candidatus Dormibacteraeota bacterium]
MTLSEAGSSLVEPYLAALAPQLTSAYSNITLTPSAGGSGVGISDAATNLIDLGGSDAYLSDSEMTQYPGLMNIPIAISAQEIAYNLPGVSDLKLSGNILAEIYQGKITKWNDPAIAKLNSGVNLPSATIVPIRRVDSSGDTFIFSSFLSATNSAWNNGPAFGTTVTWPAVTGELTATGNPGMVQAAHATPDSIAYIGISVKSSIQSAGLGIAELQNKAGKFVSASQATITSAVTNSAQDIPSNLAQSLIYEPGAQSYPIVNYEYMMVQKQQKDANTALAIRTFLTWAVDSSGGANATNLASVNFIALPSNVLLKIKPAIGSITSGS